MKNARARPERGQFDRSQSSRVQRVHHGQERIRQHGNQGRNGNLQRRRGPVVVVLVLDFLL